MKRFAVVTVAVFALFFANNAQAKDVNGLLGIGGEAGAFAGDMGGNLLLTYYLSQSFGLQGLLSVDVDMVGDADAAYKLGLGVRGLIGIAGGKSSTLAFVIGAALKYADPGAGDGGMGFAIDLGLRAEHFLSGNFAIHGLMGSQIQILTEDLVGASTKRFGIGGGLLGSAGFSYYF